MPSLRVAAAVALVIASPALAGEETTPFRCEARGGSAWRQYRTAHFLVATDLSGVRAEAVVRDLERLRALVLQAMVGEQVEIPGKVRAVVFAEPADFRRMGPQPFHAYFNIDWLSRPTVVLPVDGFQENPEILAEVLAFHLSWYLFPRQPHWFTIGLGKFIATVGRPRDQALAKTGTRIVHGGRETGGYWAGLAPPGLVKFLRRAGSGMPEDILTWSGWGAEDRTEEVTHRYHAWSWLLYHWLWNTRPKPFADFTNRLSNAEEPAAAWRAAFPGLDPARPGGTRALSDALEAYLRDGRFEAYEVKAPYDARSSVVPLSPAEVHMILVDASWKDRDAASVGAAAEEALREDPLHPVALWRAVGERDRLAAMRKATEGRPDDWRAWYLLALALERDEDRVEREAALRKATGLEPDSAVARNRLAWLLRLSGRAKEALAFANAAVDLAPWYPPAVDTLAAVASDLGKCREAAILEHRAVDLARPGPQGSSYAKHLAEIEARCAANSAPRK